MFLPDFISDVLCLAAALVAGAAITMIVVTFLGDRR